jgi:cell division initiation protein
LSFKESSVKEGSAVDLTPQDIEKKTFHDTFRGYSQKEVDEFLDQVTEAFSRIYRENQSLRERMKELEEQYKESRGTEDMLKRTLVTATKAAEETVESAKAEAQGMMAEAGRKAQKLIADAEIRARELVSDAAKRESDLQGRIDGLKRFEEEYRSRVQALIESQLRVLSEGPVATVSPAPAPARPPAPSAPAGVSASPGPVSGTSDAVEDRTKPATPSPAATPIPAATPTPPAQRPVAPVQPGTTQPTGSDREAAPAWAPAPPSKALGAQPGDAGSSEKTSMGEESQETKAETGEKDDLEEERTIKRLFWGED